MPARPQRRELLNRICEVQVSGQEGIKTRFPMCLRTYVSSDSVWGLSTCHVGSDGGSVSGDCSAEKGRGKYSGPSIKQSHPCWPMTSKSMFVPASLYQLHWCMAAYKWQHHVRWNTFAQLTRFWRGWECLGSRDSWCMVVVSTRMEIF